MTGKCIYCQLKTYPFPFRLNARPEDTIGEGRMYSVEGSMCPVASYKKYLTKLHPEQDALWQRSFDNYTPDMTTWYTKCPLGKNQLACMMQEISKVGKLSKIYTNHSVRATSITALDDSGIEARHIIRQSGHRSELSIKNYSCR